MTQPLVEIDNLKKSFGEQTVLKGVDLVLEKGTILGLMGPSGCGKTTVLRVIAGLTVPDGGRVTVFGHNLLDDEDQESAEVLRRQMGVVFQGGALFDSLTVGENVAFPLRYCLGMTDRDEIVGEVERALAEVDLVGIESKYPSELSGGMRKRAAIARALVYRPALVLLDEPTTGLDPETARHIDRLVLSLARQLDLGVLVVTHDLTSAFGICDRIALLDEGRVAWCGLPSQWDSADHPTVRRFASGMLPIREEGRHPD
ncbi:MAG: ATP-binding cassette domain-containing protein [Synergistaceae bacterium]|jgi:phospholipid/cholesterol/gamma-HCH transport system ATP-binding protein|nr:ATP-binding cassette domain-containing protein [Synergistaceae bacterium]